MKWLAAVLALVASDAAALSCMQPTIADSFARAERVPEDIYILKGTLTFDEARLPETDMLNDGWTPPPIAAEFRGFALNRGGFTTRYDRDVLLQPLCVGPWCGGAASGEVAIMFAKVLGDDLVIDAPACGGTIFYNVTRAMEQEAVACMNGDCSAGQPNIICYEDGACVAE